MGQRAAQAEIDYFRGERADPSLTRSERIADFVDEARYNLETVGLGVVYLIRRFGPVQEPVASDMAAEEVYADQSVDAE